MERSRVLDLGIGSGALGRHLRERLDCRLDGVTINSDEQAVARNWYERIEVLNLDQPDWDASFSSQSYDAIVCADVLEHLARPELVLAACHRLLKPAGVLLVSVPNVAYAGLIADLLRGNFKYGNEGLMDRTHLRFFTRRSFEQLLGDQGWTARRVEVVDQPLHETEFTMAFDALPPAVARHLLAQPDANAYQLVFAATPSNTAHPVEQRELPTAPDVSAATFVAQLFVGTAQGFRGDRKLTRHGKIGVERQLLRFDIPASMDSWPSLRLDPADRPGFFSLHRMVLRDAASNARWEWSASEERGRELAACNRHQIEVTGFDAATGALRLLMLGDDPHFVLPLPEAVAAGCAGQDCRLEVECGWPLSADYLAAAQRFQQLEATVQEQARRIQALEVAAAQPAVAAATPPAPLPPPPAKGWKGALASLLGRAQDAPTAHPPRFDPIVEIIVPIYGNLPLVQRCLASVLSARVQCAYHLTLINDASPEPSVREWLREFAAANPAATVIENTRNLGFVETVNLGMRSAGRRDVVLLNSDTEVANDWLDRLRAAAVSRESAGTVTPFSNNATICSYPQFCIDNPLLPGYDTASTDRLCAEVNRGQVVDIPTGVGFCMYITRACLDEVGEFDAANFGKGYGEENDFCLRATALGWRHLHALDVFVYHEGGASFKESRVALQANALQAIRRLHPGYEDMIRDFVKRDPARPYREAMDRARAA